MKTKHLLILLFFCLIQNSYSQCQETIYAGEGTYYTYTGFGSCSYGNPNPHTKLPPAAINGPQYGASEPCGMCAEITGPRGQIIVSIEDQCPECKYGDIDLDMAAFPSIADLIEGRVKITWKIVACPVTGPIVIHFKDKSNQYWTAVQVRNSRFPAKKLEYKMNDGSFKEAVKVDYNYFLDATGMGVGPYDFRITDIFGHVIEAFKIPFIENGDVVGTEQFPSCDVITETSRPVQTQIAIYPNPAQNRISTLCNKNSFEVNYLIMDITGHLLIEDTIGSYSEQTIEFSEAGTYIIKIMSISGLSEIKKVVVY